MLPEEQMVFESIKKMTKYGSSIIHKCAQIIARIVSWKEEDDDGTYAPPHAYRSFAHCTAAQ